MNHRYKVEDREFILTEEEHQKVVNAVMKGGGMVLLRNGNLMINTAFIRRSSPTNDSTDYQAELQQKQLILESKKYDDLVKAPRGKFVSEKHMEYYAKMGWPHREGCICKSGDK